jgi:hypothetical protein
MKSTGKNTRRAKYKGITRHARQLGVSRPHLWQVLEGYRESRSLMDRYRRLVGSAGKAV